MEQRPDAPEARPADPAAQQVTALAITRRRLLQLGGYVAPSLLTLSSLLPADNAAAAQQRVTVRQRLRVKIQALTRIRMG